MPTSHISTDTLKSVEPDADLAAIKAKRWWQGSVFPSSEALIDAKLQPDYWIIASQACNIYNEDFAKIPLIELVGGKHLDKRDPVKARGENPRLLHVLAVSETEGVSIELDIMVRHWIPRRMLAKIGASRLRLSKTSIDDPKGIETDWNDLFASWISRSYTRVALPDDFNAALRQSKIEKSIDSKLIKRSDDIHGIYFSIESDNEDVWRGALGEMPPPYLLGMVLIIEEHADGNAICNQFTSQIFEENQADPLNPTSKVSRVELARRLGIRIIKEDIQAKSVNEITLQEISSLVRFSMSDHLSDSSDSVH